MPPSHVKNLCLYVPFESPCNFLCSTAHQLHQPSLCHPVHGRPAQPQLSGQHGWKEGAALRGRRGHEWPAGVELGLNSANPALSPRALILCLYQLKRKATKKARTLYKMYKMKDYFFKWLQYYILFFDKKNPLVMKRNHFIDIYSVILFNFCSPPHNSPSPLTHIATTSVQM